MAADDDREAEADTPPDDWRDPWSPVPLEQLRPTPLGPGLQAMQAALRWALTEGITTTADLTAQIAANRDALLTLRRLAPERFAAIDAEIQPLRHRLLQAELEAAADLAALGRVIDLHKAALAALERSRPDLVAQLRDLYRNRKAALTPAAA